MKLLSLLEPAWVKPALVALALSTAAAGGWWVRAQEADADIAELKAAHDQEKAKAVSEALAEQTLRFKEERDEIMRAAAIDKREIARLQGDRNETNRLRECVRDGTCGLRVAAKCPASRPSGVPGPGPSTSVGTARGAELDDSARRAYFSLREGINTATRQLSACQATLKNLTKQ